MTASPKEPPKEPIAFVPPREIAPFVLVDGRGDVVLQLHANRQKFFAWYKTLGRARSGAARWGGRVWNRISSRFETEPVS